MGRDQGGAGETIRADDRKTVESAGIDSGLFCLRLLLRFHGIAVQPEALRHRSGRTEGTLSVNELILLARDLGMKARLVRSYADRLVKNPLPAIALRKDGTSVVVAQINREKREVLLHDPVLA